MGEFALQETYVTWLIIGWLIAIFCVLMAGCILVSRDYDDDQRNGR
jgi:1,4-dihydroxy-2-naphthoate octaprenyltransferase